MEISEENSKKLKTIRIILFIFLITLGYAVLRYNVFKGVPWNELPGYVTNKAIAWTSLISVCLSYLPGLLHKLGVNWAAGMLPLRKYLGTYGFALAAVHIVLTLSMLTAETYPSLFTGNTINEKGEYVILFGLSCLMGFTMPAIVSIKAVRESMTEKKWKRIQQLGYIALAANAAHVFAMGFGVWFAPSAWPGYMPPITMISASFSIAVIFLKLIALIKYKT